MFGVPIESILIILGASVFGFAAHVLMKVAELRDADPTMTLHKYFSINPYRSAAKLMTVIIAVVAVAEPQITPLVIAGGAGIGYAADSAGNRILKNLGS